MALDMQLFPMSGVFPFWTRFREASRTRYVKVLPRENCFLFPTEIGEIRGFMCSSSEIFFQDGSSLEACCRGFIFKEDENVGDSELEGYIHKNAMSTSVHLHFGSNPNAAHTFVERCRMDRNKAAAVAAAAAAAVAGAGPEAAAAAGAAAAEAVTAVFRECSDIVPYTSLEMAIRRDYLSYHVGNAQNQGDDSTSSESTSYSGTFWPSCTDSAQTVQEDKTLRRTESFDLHHLRRTTSLDAHSSVYLRSGSEIWDRQQVRAQQLLKESNQDVEDCSSTKLNVTKWNCNGNAAHPNILSLSYRPLGSEQQQSPKRIMSLLPSATEILIELGAGDRLVAVTDCCDRPSGAQRGRHVVGSSKLDVAAGSTRHVRTPENLKPYLGSLACNKRKLMQDSVCMAKVKPDLVVTHEEFEGGGDGNILTTLVQGRGYPGEDFRLHVFRPCRVPEIFDSILNLGDAVGLYVEACSMVERLRRRLRKVAICVAPQKRPRMLLLQGLNPLILGGHWIPEVEALAGGYDGLQKSGCELEMLHWQRIISYAPEVLVLSPCSLTIQQTLSEVELLARLHGFWSIPAVEAGQVYICGHSTFSSPGSRIVNGVELLASLLHPTVTSSLELQETAWKLGLNYGQQCSPQDLKKHFKPWV
eukprot:c24487_g1_i1 orf=1355-3280(+)